MTRHEKANSLSLIVVCSTEHCSAVTNEPTLRGVVPTTCLDPPSLQVVVVVNRLHEQFRVFGAKASRLTRVPPLKSMIRPQFGVRVGRALPTSPSCGRAERVQDASASCVEVCNPGPSVEAPCYLNEGLMSENPATPRLAQMNEEKTHAVLRNTRFRGFARFKRRTPFGQKWFKNNGQRRTLADPFWSRSGPAKTFVRPTGDAQTSVF